MGMEPGTATLFGAHAQAVRERAELDAELARRATVGELACPERAEPPGDDEPEWDERVF